MTGDAGGETDIRKLDANTVARIAAGEVVERPASAVKELLENSLDADASRVDVTVEEGGTELIRVADDGRGMTEADVRAAVREHTTSKIHALEDLESGVATLGFRGEALHTIGSVSRLRIRTRPRADAVDDERDAVGTELVYEGGEVRNVEPAGCPEGTTVEVTDLFYNTPARRKFLKTTATEFAHVNRIVTRYALANPDVAISLTHDGREVFATTGQGDLQAAVLAVYGREVARSMIAVDADAAALPAGPLESVSGLVSHPETNRSTREYLATYVNGRAVTADAVREGIMGAYGTQLGGSRYPFVVLFLDVPGAAVDVNVHPRKREVRFDDDDAVRRQVDAAVESALLEHGLLRSGAPRGRSAPAETQVTPERTGQRGQSAQSTATTDGAESDHAGETDPAESDSVKSATPRDAATTDAPAVDAEADGSETTKSNAGERRDGSTARTAETGRVSETTTAETARTPETGVESASTSEQRSLGSASKSRSDRTELDDSGGSTSTAADRSFRERGEQRTLSGDVATDETAFDSLPRLRVLGQFRDTYLVCEAPDGLVLLDQHAADERVNYERLQAAFAADASAQALAEPVELELTATEAEAFEHHREALARLGFYADRVEDRTVAVTTVPAVLEKTLEPAQLRDVLASFVEGDRETGAETVDALADAFLADLACYPSITGNTSLSEGSVIDLLEALDDCENPYSCPHGRPVLVSIDDGEIEDRFERDYPGHAG